MDEFNNIKLFENYISWIDAIVSLCRNLDLACTNLDQEFPSEINSSSLLFYLKNKSYYANIINSTYPTEFIIETNDDDKYTNINEDYYNIRKTLLENNVENNSINNEVVNNNKKYNFKPRNRNKNKHINNNNNNCYSLIIKGLRTNEINNNRIRCVYNLESDIMKKLPIGEKMCVLKKSAKNDDTILIKYTNEYDYLLDQPFEIIPDTDVTDDNNRYQCSVTGVYWDKKSWIASWYQGKKRFYKSFSSKMYGFYRSKYFAIQTRLHNQVLCNPHKNSNKESQDIDLS